jgi:hypothetical protein
VGTKENEWAQTAARKIIEKYADVAAIETANYQECGFIMAAAKLALSDDAIASRIARLMEPHRADRA